MNNAGNHKSVAEGLLQVLLVLGTLSFVFVSAANANEEKPFESEQQVQTKQAEKISTADNANRFDQIEKSDFGVVTDRTGLIKQWKLHPVVVVPNLPGVQYAWKLKCKNSNPVFVREEFTLPEAPSTWKIKQDEASTELTKGGQQCILESFQPTDEGWLGHSWTVSQGDPAGRYEIKLWVNGVFAHQFIFNVGEPLAQGKESREF